MVYLSDGDLPMHELSIAESILSIVEDYAQRNDVSRVLSVRLRIGEMSGVVPDALAFCFEICAKRTIAEGASLEIERVPLSARCRACNATFNVEGYCFLCPDCGSTEVEIISGRELQVTEMEVE